ncbi:MAG: hypothetical protein H6859_04640 [Rhodospirillales bacterium]|nr:hypothetical protein [Alphaproteobacteria bacterium]USO06472.1 MAG: hypothetical protein H6859_04640 [Rhodospirillales bacterium]
MKLFNYNGSSALELKRPVLKLVFAERLVYDRKTGFRTPNLSSPFKALRDISGTKWEMARPRRFELLTS